MKEEGSGRGEISLCAIEEKDIPALSGLLCDEAVGESYMVPDYERAEQWRALAERIAALSRDKTRYVRGVYLDGTLVGLINDVELKDGGIELGWAIIGSCQGRGIGTEALKLAIEELRALGYKELWAAAFEDNYPSLRIMEKCGMTPCEKCETIDYRGREHRCLYRRLEL